MKSIALSSIGAIGTIYGLIGIKWAPPWRNSFVYIITHADTAQPYVVMVLISLVLLFWGLKIMLKK